MFSDRARIHVVAGHGGNGALSFRREAHVPRGGPDGGDGGNGGDVVLVCDEGLRDLRAVRERPHYRAPRGGHGSGGRRHGASGQSLEIAVPCGTVARASDGAFQFDLARPGQRAVVARGGSGGRGNARFANATRQTPRFAELGIAGEKRSVDLRLKLVADAGLIGLPNAGKSSLLRRLTRAHPKVADYPFTTIEPVLGTLESADRQVVVCDIPGLIEGASAGTGLGHEFLAHVERTSLIVHVIDCYPLDGTDPVSNYATVEAEVAGYDERLAGLPRLVCLSKADLVAGPVAESARERLLERTRQQVLEVVVTSAATGLGLDELSAAIMRHVPRHPPRQSLAREPVAEHQVYRPRADTNFAVDQPEAGRFRVVGPAVERLLARHDPDNPEAMRYVEQRLRAMGVLSALAQAGYEPGDDLEIAGMVFELDPDEEA